MPHGALPAALRDHPWSPSANFMGLPDRLAAWESSSAVVLPIPYEATTSWMTGTRAGPAAILAASRYVERHDLTLDREPCASGICTLPAVDLSRSGPETAIGELRALYFDLLEAAGDRFVVALGGEHSISSAPATAWAERLGPELSILQFDAHADLREEYRGTPWNHACVMRRILDHTDRIVSVGIRAVTSEERAVIRDRGIVTVLAREMRDPGWQDRVVEALGPRVYITFDVDFLDPSVMPATGAPEPGGASWWDAVELLERVFAARRVVGADVVELAPRRGEEAADFTAAKLVYRMIGLAAADPGKARGQEPPAGPAEAGSGSSISSSRS